MVRNIIGAWMALQTLLVQVIHIKGEVSEDVPTINRALSVYSSPLSSGLTDEQIDKLPAAIAHGDLMELLK